MSHTPGLLCSECGRQARRERALYKSRRPGKLIAIAALLLVASYAVRVYPAVRERGWVAAVPTSVLILAARITEPQAQRVRFTRGQIVTNADSRWCELLVIELIEHRMPEHNLPHAWQRMLACAVLGDPWSEDLIDDNHWPSDRDLALGGIGWAVCENTEIWTYLAPNQNDIELHTRAQWPRSTAIYARPEASRGVGSQRHQTKMAHGANAVVRLRHRPAARCLG